MGITGSLARRVGPQLHRLAPELNSSFVHESLRRALAGVGPLPPAASAAEKQLREQKGDIDKGIHEVIENHVRLAGAQGLLTNLGGLATAPVTIPANIAGLTLLQCRMVAGIAHLRAYDLDDPRVHNAVLACLLGESRVTTLVRKGKLPAPPMAIATAPAHDPDLDRLMAAEVTSALVDQVFGKRAASAIARRTPVVGGLVGAGTDGYSTWQIGRYADRELLLRRRD